VHHPITAKNQEWLKAHCMYDAAQHRVRCRLTGQEVTRLNNEVIAVEEKGPSKHNELLTIDVYVCPACRDVGTTATFVSFEELAFNWRPEELPIK
jgi:hypothetical protein